MWERRLYGEVLRPDDRVLLVGCGTGRDLVGLHELGCDVTGLDPAPRIVDIARKHLARRNIASEVLAGFVETADLGRRYDAVVFSPGVYAYVPQSASRIAALARIGNHLTPGGQVVISYTEMAEPSPWAIWLVGVTARFSRADWRPEPGDCFARDYHAERVLRYEHQFRTGEVTGDCEAAGFRIVRDEAVKGALRYVVVSPAPAVQVRPGS
jgi:SAM-dependent methyltransferase